MDKYNAYDNELTRYLNLIMGYSIKDIVGDIVGDILYFDAPINKDDGTHSIEVETPTGLMTIKIIKQFSKTSLIFSRKNGESICEEYKIELAHIPINFLVYGSVLEKREKGIILTNIIRFYDYLNHDDADKRLINSEETRSVFDYNQLEKIYPNTLFSNLNIEDTFAILKNIIDLSRMKRISPLINTRIDLKIPNYISSNYRTGEFPNNHSIVVNKQSPILLYEFIKGNKTLERVNDLLHGDITSRDINDLKTMIDANNCIESKTYLYGFNYLSNLQTSTNGETRIGHLDQLESELIGPSKVTMTKEYYEYLRKLLLDTFGVELIDSIKPNDVVELIKTNYRRYTNES